MTQLKKLYLILFLPGLVPAAVILVLLRFDETGLVVLGQAIEGYNLSQLTATLLSFITPFYLILPFALSGSGRQGEPAFWALVSLCPMLLSGPSLVAGMLVGGQSPASSLIALLLLGLILPGLVLWLENLRRWMSPHMAMIIYGAVWACSEFFSYLALYIIPYLEVPALKLVIWINWLLPQIGSLNGLQEYLQSGELLWKPLLPALIQIPVLALLLRFGQGHRESPGGSHE